MIKVGLFGYGRAGQAVANVLSQQPGIDLRWIARRSSGTCQAHPGAHSIPVVGLDEVNISDWLDQHPVDAIVDFSNSEALSYYGEEVSKRGLMLVSAISAYSDQQMAHLKVLGESSRVMSSPNITLGINFLILAAKLLRGIAPFADVEIVEQHFREKPEISGTARKIASTLSVETDRITSLRLGGIVGHHEVIFGFPHQTVRLTHDSIRREAFGTGAAFALQELATCKTGFYTFDDLLMKKIRLELLAQ